MAPKKIVTKQLQKQKTMIRSYLLTGWIAILFSISLLAQANPIEIIARFEPEINVNAWQQAHLSTENAPIRFKEFISQRFNLAVFTCDTTRISLAELKEKWGKDILWVAPNHSEVTSRATPDDPQFINQWGLTNIHVAPFWDINTNGITYNGDTIVAAVMESGTSINHPDLVPNFWHNYQEIPNDGLDNDNNGYVDDYLGWNATTLSDNHIYDPHGTQVSGVLGAKGNNALGISGVNWNIKIMPVSFTKSAYSTYFKTFEYLIDQRQLYNETNGQKGAFITVVNESFGQDNVSPSDNPNFQQWCEYMDALGDVGILTVGATNNSPSANVDTQGDMPTTCPQDYLIAVTSISSNGIRQGGFGKVNIDLGAPGADIITTNGTNSFASFGGTSTATPHVAGAVALIYSYPCERWGQFIQAHPAEAALKVKKWILDNTVPLATLKNLTVSNGSLNFDGILSDLDYFCAGNRLEPLSLNITPTLTNDLINYKYDVPKFGEFELHIYNMLGQKILTEKLSSDKATLQEGSINVRFLPAGVYVLMIQQGSEYFVQKFVRY